MYEPLIGVNSIVLVVLFSVLRFCADNNLYILTREFLLIAIYVSGNVYFKYFTNLQGCVCYSSQKNL